MTIRTVHDVNGIAQTTIVDWFDFVPKHVAKQWIYYLILSARNNTQSKSKRATYVVAESMGKVGYWLETEIKIKD